MRNVIAAVFILFVSSFCLHAQPDRSDVRRGNRDFRKEAWKEAEIDYRKALVIPRPLRQVSILQIPCTGWGTWNRQEKVMMP